MLRVIVLVRVPSRLKVAYSLEFDLPAVPSIGSYISIQRPDNPQPYGEDMIVRKVWWRLDHAATWPSSDADAKGGSVNEIFVECEIATSPYSSDEWLAMVEGARSHGIEVDEFQVAWFSVRDRGIRKK